MWRALFVGWLAIALADEAFKDSESPGVAKRQTARGNTVVYGASPDQYSLQTPERGVQQQFSLTSPGRKTGATSALAYPSESPRRPQYIQLSALQLQAAQQLLQHQQLQQQGVQHQAVQPQAVQQRVVQPQVSYESEPGHGVLYKPRQQESKGQFAASAIVDSQLYPQAGSFERELAQLVAANRAQEQKYNAVTSPTIRKQPQQQLQPQAQPPEQYLKEITRPVAHRVQQVQYQPAQQVQPTQSVQSVQPQTPQQVYRYVYQPDQLQQIQGTTQYRQIEPQYIRQPQVQQYAQSPASQSQTQSIPLRLRHESDSLAPVSLRQGISVSQLTGAAAATQPEAPSRSTIYVSQSTPLKKPTFSLPQPQPVEEEEKPLVKIPARNRPLTQDEFQSLLHSGAYSATLVPSNDPHSPHQEYLLHSTAAQQQPRQAYANEKEVTYLLPQSPQRPVKRRPVFSVQQA